jgi:hypothetical protein
VTITADPDTINKTAVSVMAEPYGYVNRAHSTIGSDCHLPFLAFGIAPSLALSGPYEGARAKLETVGKQGTETFQALATGLADVAKTLGAAEAANTMVCVPAKLEPTGIASDGSDRTGTQAGVLSVEVMLLMEWIATGGVIAACGALAPSALAALATWALVQPDDASISRAISAWESVSDDVKHSKEYLDLALKPLDGAWPDDDSSRQAFDKWMIPFGDNVDQYAEAAGQLGDTLKEAVGQVHEVQTETFLTASITLGTLIALTAMDAIPFAAAVIEPLKEVVGAILDIEVGAQVVIVGVVLKSLFDLFKGMIETVDSFDMDKPGSHTLPKFEDVKIDWAGSHP